MGKVKVRNFNYGNLANKAKRTRIGTNGVS